MGNSGHEEKQGRDETQVSPIQPFRLDYLADSIFRRDVYGNAINRGPRPVDPANLSWGIILSGRLALKISLVAGAEVSGINLKSVESHRQCAKANNLNYHILSNTENR